MPMWFRPLVLCLLIPLLVGTLVSCAVNAGPGITVAAAPVPPAGVEGRVRVDLVKTGCALFDLVGIPRDATNFCPSEDSTNE